MSTLLGVNASTQPPVQRLLHRLDLTAGEAPGHWFGKAGENALNGSGRLFGGMVVAQAMVAAARSDLDRRIHSVQQVFLRAGKADVELEYHVTDMLVGRTYRSVAVDVRQRGELISHAIVGLTSGIDGPDRQASPPVVASREGMVNRDQHRGRADWEDRPIEFRFDPVEETDRQPESSFWIRPVGDFEAAPYLHQALLGYASDRALMSVGWKPHHDLARQSAGATLNHSLWFHRPVDFTDWHSFVTHSPTLVDGRGLINGQIHTAAGELIASATQEGTFRVPRTS